jgi:alpha/beta superfamily hydrolase
VRFPAADGGDLIGDLAEPAGARAGAVVCHPHPAYGGDRHNAVVDRVFHALAAAGIASLRFDFRGGGEHAGDDLRGAIELMAEPAEGAARPLWLVGYSFGADVALATDDGRVAGWAAIAPPLRFGDGPPRPAEGDPRPALVLAAEHDQFNPPDRVRDATKTWPTVDVDVIPMADHFLAGATGTVADKVVAWLKRG